MKAMDPNVEITDSPCRPICPEDGVREEGDLEYISDDSSFYGTSPLFSSFFFFLLPKVLSPSFFFPHVVGCREKRGSIQ